MRYRIPIPTAKELHRIFEYKDGMLFYKNNPMRGWVRKGDRAGYFCKSDGYRRVTLGCISYAEHRLIWRMHNPRGTMPFVLDHIDGNRSNNDINNLRRATESDNQNNRHVGVSPKVVGSGKLQKFLKRRRVQ